MKTKRKKIKKTRKTLPKKESFNLQNSVNNTRSLSREQSIIKEKIHTCLKHHFSQR